MNHLIKRYWLCVTLCVFSASVAASEALDFLIIGGRVIDPSIPRDEVINLGIKGGKIAWLGNDNPKATKVIDAEGLVVAPGFIDLHSHAINTEGQRYQAFDGVTTALELEAGVFPIDALRSWHPEGAVINYGASVSVLAVHHQVMGNVFQPHFSDPLKPVTEIVTMSPKAAFNMVPNQEELAAIIRLIKVGLEDGALGIGLPLDYMSSGVRSGELQEIFRLAAEFQARVFVHLRRGLPGELKGLSEILELAGQYGAPVHICHLQASMMSGTSAALEALQQARASGVDVSYEAYPYNAGSTKIGAAVFGRNWQQVFDIDYKDVQLVETGERLTAERFIEERHKNPSGFVVHHYGKPDWTKQALLNRNTIVASDAMPIQNDHSFVHPRGIGTFTRVLSKYVDEHDAEGQLTLFDAIAKMTTMPAQLLAKMSSTFNSKGHLKVGADADVVLLNPDLLRDRATYLNPLQPSLGVTWLFVAGKPLVSESQWVDHAKSGDLVVADRSD